MSRTIHTMRETLTILREKMRERQYACLKYSDIKISFFGSFTYLAVSDFVAVAVVLVA